MQSPDPGATADATARGVFFVVEPDRAGLEAITELIDGGGLAPAADRVVPLAETRAAYEALGKEHRRGKIVLHVGDGDGRRPTRAGVWRRATTPRRAAPPDSPKVSACWRSQPVAGTTVPKDAAAICWT